jgi:hypothetical protein
LNITISKMFEEMGRLHMQVQAQQEYIAELEAKVAAASKAPASTSESPAA